MRLILPSLLFLLFTSAAFPEAAWFPGLDKWSLTVGPSLSANTAGDAAHGPALGFDIAINWSPVFSFQTGVTTTLLRHTGRPAWNEAKTAFTQHISASLLFLEAGYSRMMLSSGKAANGWHFCLAIPWPLVDTEPRRGPFEADIIQLYWRPTWIYFPSGYEVFHEIGIAYRFRTMLE